MCDVDVVKQGKTRCIYPFLQASLFCLAHNAFLNVFLCHKLFYLKSSYPCCYPALRSSVALVYKQIRSLYIRVLVPCYLLLNRILIVRITSAPLLIRFTDLFYSLLFSSLLFSSSLSVALASFMNSLFLFVSSPVRVVSGKMLMENVMTGQFPPQQMKSVQIPLRKIYVNTPDVSLKLTKVQGIIV